MFQSVDLRYLRMASRFGTDEPLDPAAPHRHELVRLLRQERKARRLSRGARLWDWVAGRLLQLKATTKVGLLVEDHRSC